MGFSLEDLSPALAVLRNDTPDIETIVNQLGGISGVIRVLPQIIRIVKTISSSSHPQNSVNEAPDVLTNQAQVRSAVLAFQEKYHLYNDGIVGPETWNKIESLISQSGG